MATNDLKLLGAWFSPFAVRVQIALNLKIPVLLHHDNPICESAIIVEYIDEVWNSNGPSILPLDAYDRANARFWVAYIDDKLFNSMRNSILAKDDEAKKSNNEQMEEALVRLEDVLNKYSDGKPYFGGDEIGFIDIAFGCYLSWLRVTEKMRGKLLDEAKTPALAKWAEAFAAHPAAKGVLPETAKLFEFTKAFFGV